MVVNATRILGLGLALGAPAGGVAQSIHGEIGPRSQAAIRISVGVALRFQAEPTATSIGSFASNAPGLRYRVLVYPALGLSDPSATVAAIDLVEAKRSASHPVLLLIVPD